MTATHRRTIFIVVLFLALVAGALWFINGSGGSGQQPGDDAETSGRVAVVPTDGGGTDPTGLEEVDRETSSASEDTSQFEVTGDFTDPEQVAHAFATTYPGDVEAIADPTFAASLDGVDSSVAAEITDPSIEHVDQSINGIREKHAFTIHGTYQGSRVPAYSIVVSRPTEPAEGGSKAENTLEFQVDSFDWSPDMLGDANSPGPAAGKLTPITAEQRGDLISQTRNNVITPILTVDPMRAPSSGRRD